MLNAIPFGVRVFSPSTMPTLFSVASKYDYTPDLHGRVVFICLGGGAYYIDFQLIILYSLSQKGQRVSYILLLISRLSDTCHAREKLCFGVIRLRGDSSSGFALPRMTKSPPSE